VKTDIAPDAEAATLLSGPEDNFDYWVLRDTCFVLLL
jgi:hypothetical protein